MATYEPGDVEQQLLHDLWLRRLAAQLAWEGVEADDIAQDTWLAALRRPPRAHEHDPAGVRGWFHRVLRNAARDRYRRHARRRSHESAAATERAAAARAGESDGSPSEAVAALERRRVLLEEVEALAEPLRRAIVARYFECESEADAAAHLGVQLETLRTRLKRGRERLRSALQRRLGGAQALLGFLTALHAGDAPSAVPAHATPVHSGASALGTRRASDGAASASPTLEAKLAMVSVVALAAVAARASLPWSKDARVGQAMSAGPAPLDSQVAAVSERPEERPSSERHGPELVPIDGLSSASDTEHELAVVLGRVVDEHGDPLAGASLQLTASERNAPDRGLPVLDSRWRRVGVVSEADDQGRFRIAAPLCGVPDVQLRIQAGLYRDFRRIHFGSHDEVGPPVLTAAEFDLGDVQLGVTAALSGRVVDEEGNPLEGVEVTLGPTLGSHYRRDGAVWSDGSGAFTIPYAPIGAYILQWRLKGYLPAHRAGLRLVASSTTHSGDLTLERAGQLLGRVLASDGSPIADARVVARPLESGQSGSSSTGQDGSFVVELWARCPHRVEVRKDGYVSRLVLPAGSADGSFEPGTSGIQFVLESAPDAFVPPRTSTMSRPRGVVRGRVLDRGVPVVGAQVLVAEAGSAPVRARNPALTRPLDIAFRAQQQIHGRIAKPEAAAFATTDRSGRFEVTGSHTGWIHVTVHRSGKAPHVLVPELTHGDAVRDLGDIHVVDGGTIAGVVLVPPGVDPVGLRVDVDGVKAYTDTRGRFRLSNVAAGDRVVVLEGRPGMLEEGAGVGATVEPGGTCDVVLDARYHGVCEVALRVLLNGEPAVGCSITLDDGMFLGPMPRIGPSDATGTATGLARAVRPATLLLDLPGHQRLDVRDEVVDLTPGARIERTLSIACGDLELVLPPGRRLPSDGVVRFELSVHGDTPRLREVACSEGSPKGGTGAELGDGRLRVSTFVAGRYHLDVLLAENAAGHTELRQPDGATTWRRTPYFEWRGEIEIRAREVSVVDLRHE